MTTISKIEWTEQTWNPIVGCDKVSPGCKHCYAESMAARLQAMETPGYERGFELTMLPQRLQDPLKRKIPTTYFVNSMSDLFHEDVPFAYIDQVFEVIAQAKQHTFQILTKRSARMVGYDPDHDAIFKGQSDLGFEFDDIARKASVSSLMEQIPRLIYADDVGMSFGELFAKTCNCSPASAAIYRDTAGHLLDHKIVEVIDSDGAKRRSGLQIKLSDQIVPARQKNLFI